MSNSGPIPETATRPEPLDPAVMISDLRQRFGLDDADSRILQELGPLVEPHLPALASRFCAALVDCRRRSAGEVQVDTAELYDRVVAWARCLTSGRYDAAYALDRLRMGMRCVHQRFEHRCILAAVSAVRGLLQEKVVTASEGCTVEERLARHRAIRRIFDLDICLISEAFYTESLAIRAEGGEATSRGPEARWAGILAAGNALVLSLDPTGRITFFNRACEELTGYRAEEVLGERLSVALAPPAAAAALQAEIDRTVQSGAELERRRPEPRPLRTRDGTDCMILWTATPVVDGSGQVVEALWVGHDVTEQHRMQSLIRHQEKMVATGQLAAGVAHEIGNPLASISAIAQTLRRKTRDDYVREKLDLVNQHIQRIVTVLRELVVFAGPDRFEWRRCDVGVILQQAIRLAQFDKRARRVEFQFDCEEPSPVTFGMEDQLTQVFFSIALNAVDALERHSGEDPLRLRITARTVTADGEPTVRIEFEDNGPGIAPEVVHRIFEPFFTTKEVGRGTGLGLAVSYRIVEEHGGRIQVDPRPGEGARFTVELPRRKAVAADQTRNREDRAES